MPRGDNPNSRKNLMKASEMTSEQLRERAKKGAKASAEARRALKTFKELDDEYTTDSERKAMLDVLKKRAKQGNLKALEIYRDTMGMKPVDKVQIAPIEAETINQIEDLIDGIDIESSKDN